MPQLSISESFIKFRLKLRKLWRGGGICPPPPPLGLSDVKKKVGLDRVKQFKTNLQAEFLKIV